MHLKTLTLRGFKSFASTTTLTFEPGVTCVVGPNGSGKSNVVDALAWVMGEQGAKSLRGGKMEDVIFAGTRARPPLGRAEVRLTIDNADGALPIDYTEVTISRTMFRSGGSEYAINGGACRLVDIQDLLSDSGLGREMHVIVGQGQLDAILTATPEERRGFIEEAAGVLKHRKRKERAVRKLDGLQANLVRLQDLTGEIKRQLGPLARQADVARRAHSIQAEARDAKARLLADDLAQLQAQLSAEVADETALTARRHQIEATLTQARNQIAELESAAAAAAPEISTASEVWFRLSALRERLRGTSALAAERVRLLGVADQATFGPDPAALDATAQRLAKEAEDLETEAESARHLVTSAAAERLEAERTADQANRRQAAILRAAADQREGLAILAGRVAAARSTVEARQDEIERLRARLAQAQEAGAAARMEFAALEGQIAGVEEGEEGLDAAHEAAARSLEIIEIDYETASQARRTAETEVATWAARHETLELSLARQDGAGALLAADAVPGLLGSLAALLEVEPGWEAAIAATLGRAASAVAVTSADAAVDTIRWLRTEDAGRAGFVIAGSDDAPGLIAPGPAPANSVWAAAVVTAPSGLAAGVAGLLDGVVLVESLAQARAVIADQPGLTAVTRGGDVLAGTWAEGGSAAGQSLIELQARHDQAAAALAAAQAELERSRFELARLEAQRQQANAEVEQTLAGLHESDARFAAVADRLGRLGAQARSSEAEVGRLNAALEEAAAALADESNELELLAAELDAAREVETDEGVVEPSDPAELEALAQAVTAARAAETEARLNVRTCEERARALRGRVEATARAAQAEREARQAAAESAERRETASRLARAVLDGTDQLDTLVNTALAEANEHRQAVETARAEREQALAAARTSAEQAAADLTEITDVVHRDELARAAQRLKIEQLQERSLEELGLEPESLLAEYGPDQLVPLLPLASSSSNDDDDNDQSQAAASAVEITGVPYVRADQEKRLRKAERALATLGRVNPLALEEYAALEERHRFLTEQLADLKKSAEDLREVIREVDSRVEQVFADAFRDTTAAFANVFTRLFPGGEGHIIATVPDDMLTTGVDIEARPAGKAVKRLSLLSGGERSLVAVAFVIAIFLARPSPFYVMDEVEAALDETNLGRLLDIVTELRRHSQILIVTHQKRTMEVADALYGVTMKDDGVTQVISQRLTDRI